MKQLLKQHLDKLQEDGIIEKVRFPTDWISPIVVAKKSNRDIRLSLDPKPLNKALKRCKYLLPVIEEVLPERTEDRQKFLPKSIAKTDIGK